MDDSFLDLIRASVSIFAVALAFVAAEILRVTETTRRYKRRRTWVKDILLKRSREGTFNLLIPQLLADDSQYRNYLRMSKDSYAWLLSRVEPQLTKLDTRCRRALTANEKLALTLRFLATGAVGLPFTFHCNSINLIMFFVHYKYRVFR